MIDFDPDTHTYTLGGRRLPSVTQVLDPLGSYAGIPLDVLERKADIGDAVHLASEMYDRGELDIGSVPKEIAGYFAGWVKFREESKFRIDHIEARVWAKKHGFAGTADRLGSFGKHLAVFDIKCTAVLMPTVSLQLAAYQLAATHSLSYAAKERFAVLLKPSGEYSLHEFKDPTDVSVFISALQLFIWSSRHAKP